MFVCPSRGRFPHIDMDHLFYACLTDDSVGCICHCPKDHIFNYTTLTCTRKLNSYINNTDRYDNKLPPVDNSDTISTFRTGQRRAVVHVENFRHQQSRHPFNNIKHQQNNIRQRNHQLQNYEISIDESTNTEKEAIDPHMEYYYYFSMEDNSFLPAWALAIIVLIILIGLLVVLLYLY